MGAARAGKEVVRPKPDGNEGGSSGLVNDREASVVKVTGVKREKKQREGSGKNPRKKWG